MNGKDKRKIYEEVERRWQDPTYSDQASILTREVMKISEEWMKQAKGINRMTVREARRELRLYIDERIDLQDMKRSYFLPTFIWVWVAGQIITFIIKWIIENHTSAR
tara:strand:+ start:280 stop:600 length:321 start_codon:yes stop_codon:yes gene_type:complete